MPLSSLLTWRERLVDALRDPARQQRAVAICVVVYAAIWTLYAVVAKSSQGINADMAEMVIWSREPALGYPRHPPFLAWVVTLWFTIFPLADWAYYLLAVSVVSSGIYVGFILAGEWLEGEKRAIVPFFLALIPFYNFLGLKFDQNSALIPLWGLASWGMARAVATRHTGWAALAGLASAAAILTKYWSVFLIAAFALAALLDHRRASYFRSKAPWISVAVGALAIGPHIWWLFGNDFLPFLHATDRRTGSLIEFFDSAFREYLGGTFAYAVAPLGLLAILVPPTLAAFKAALPGPAEERQLAFTLFWLPIVVPIAGAALVQVKLLSLWSAPAYGLLPVVLLSASIMKLPPRALSWFVTAAATISLAALVASPAVAWIKLRNGVENDAGYVRPLAAAVEAEWRQTSDQRLRIVAGPFESVHSIAFYLADHPTTLVPYGPFRLTVMDDFPRYRSPWVDKVRLRREGATIVCPAEDASCLAELGRLVTLAPLGRRIEMELTPNWFGLRGRPARFVIATIPPSPLGLDRAPAPVGLTHSPNGPFLKP
jgi:4-amino-4-deoxy-L-arabinose transferase-like glycosyltransferase